MTIHCENSRPFIIVFIVKSISGVLLLCVIALEFLVFFPPISFMKSPLFAPLAQSSEDLIYLVFRALVGLLFLQHGLQKVGLLEGSFNVQGFIGFIGICELAGGIAIAIGLWTRLVAVLGTVLLVGAYATAHAGNGLLPIANRGELALLYIATFAVLFLYGSRKLSVEKSVFGREFF